MVEELNTFESALKTWHKGNALKAFLYLFPNTYISTSRCIQLVLNLCIEGGFRTSFIMLNIVWKRIMDSRFRCLKKGIEIHALLKGECEC